jgi:hypothetical protein
MDLKSIEEEEYEDKEVGKGKTKMGVHRKRKNVKVEK